MSNKNIYILLTDTGTLLGNVIKYYTKKPYSHASIAFDSDLIEVYSFGRKEPSNPFIGGFVKENIRNGFFQNARCAIYRYEVKEDEWQKMYRFIQYIEAEKHRYRYNFLGLFSFIVNKNIKRKNAFFCSQFVATVLSEGGTIQFDKPLASIRPLDLLEHNKFELIYEGSLRRYEKFEVIMDSPNILKIV